MRTKTSQNQEPVRTKTQSEPRPSQNQDPVRTKTQSEPRPSQNQDPVRTKTSQNQDQSEPRPVRTNNGENLVRTETPLAAGYALAEAMVARVGASVSMAAAVAR